MAGPLDLRGRVVVSDGATATLNRIKGSLDAVGASTKRLTTTSTYLGNISRSLGVGAQRVHKHAVALSGAAAGVGVGLGGIIASTREFNESKFGYGFARITDFIKDGRLDLQGWKKDMDATAQSTRRAAKDFGTTADVTMKAREETEKLGFKGREAESIFGAALGLHLSEPSALASGEAAKYMGAVYRAYEKQRQQLAARIGADANDPKFVDAYIKGLAGKAAVAGAESALGPADIVEGMRQFAPQWAAMGIPYEFALAALGHGSNYGFRAPELGTAYKSMINKIINPTSAGLGILNNLKIDRQQFFKAGAVEPGKAATTLNSLLSGSLYTGKGGAKNKTAIRAMLDKAYKDGSITSPDFQERLTQRVGGMLGKPWAGRAQEIHQAVANATLNATGDVDLPRYLKSLRDAGATVGQIATIFEGRHISRNMPIFQFYEKLIALYDKLQGVDGGVMDAVVEGRKATEAGSTDQLFGAWKELMLAMQDTGVIETAKNALIGIANALRALPPDVVKYGTGLVLLAGGISALGLAVTGAMPILAGLKALGLLGAAGVAAGAGAVLGGATRAGGFLGPAAVGAPIMGAGAAAGAGVAAKRAGLRLIPGLGWVILAGGAAYGGYQSYAKGGDWWDIVKGSTLGAVGMSPAEAAGAPSGIPNPADAMSSLPEAGPAGAVSQQTAAIRAQLAAVDLTGDGQRIMSTLEAGIRAGMAGVLAAMDQTVSGIRDRAAAAASAGRVNLNTGPTMSGAR